MARICAPALAQAQPTGMPGELPQPDRSWSRPSRFALVRYSGEHRDQSGPADAAQSALASPQPASRSDRRSAERRCCRGSGAERLDSPLLVSGLVHGGLPGNAGAGPGWAERQVLLACRRAGAGAGRRGPAPGVPGDPSGWIATLHRDSPARIGRIHRCGDIPRTQAAKLQDLREILGSRSNAEWLHASEDRLAVASHRRSHRKGGHTTLDAHIPERHRAHLA